MSSPAEPNLQFQDITIVYQFAIDLLKLSPDDSIKPAVEKLLKEDFVVAAMEFYSAEMRAQGIGEIGEGRGATPERLAHTDPLTHLPVKRALEFWRWVDYNILEEPYFEAQNLARFRLVGFKSRLPLLSKPVDVSVYLTVNRFGVAVLSFWYQIQEPLSTDQLTHLEVLPMLEKPTITASIPLEVLEAASRYDRSYKDIVKQARDAGKDAVPFGQKNPLTFQGLSWYYWGPVLNAVQGNKYNSHEDMLKVLRSEAFLCFPFVIADKINPSMGLGADYLAKAPRKIYQVVNQSLDFPPELIAGHMIETDIGTNLSNRADVLYLNTLGCALIALGSKTPQIAAQISKSPLNDLRGRFEAQEGEDGARLEVARIVLEALDVIEITLFQRMLLSNIEEYYSGRDLIKMRSSEMVRMRESLAFQLETIHGSKVFRESLARQRFERAKEVMLVEEAAEALQAKLENIETAQASLHELRTEVYQAVLGVLLGVIPSILLLTPVENSVIAGIVSIILSGAATILANRFSLYYWKILRRREKL